MQDERTTDGQPAEQSTEAAPPPPLYGTKESAAGLPSASTDAGDIARLASTAPPQNGPLARPGQRLAARVLDIVIFGIVFFVGQAVTVLAMVATMPELRKVVLDAESGQVTPEQVVAVQQAMGGWAVVPTIVTLVLWFLYEVPLTALRGQTVGKLAVGVRVTTPETPGVKVGWSIAGRRWMVLALPSVLGTAFGLPLQAIDCGWILTDKTRPRCLHDKFARTDVVVSRGS